MTSEKSADGTPKYRRRMRNYLLDVGLQVRYTMTIVVVAVAVTAGLGYKMYQATRDISKVIELSGMADPVVAAELRGQFSESDKWVLWGIVGFGVVLVFWSRRLGSSSPTRWRGRSSA